VNDQHDIEKARGQLQIYEELLNTEPENTPEDWARRCRFLREVDWPTGEHVDPDRVRSVRRQFEEAAEQARRDLHRNVAMGDERAFAVHELLADDPWWSTDPDEAASE
jgi:hypothetical protein